MHEAGRQLVGHDEQDIRAIARGVHCSGARFTMPRRIRISTLPIHYQYLFRN
jgi:hypothetical protein